MAAGAVTIAALLTSGLLALQAAGPQTFAIPPGPADQTVNQLAAQAGIDIVVVAQLRGRRTPAIHGRLPVEAALARLLRPLNLRAVRIGEDMYRIEAAPPPRPRPSPPGPATPHAPGPPTELGDVVVTAAPPVGLREAAGRSVLDPGALQRLEGAPASDGLADLSATVESTRQGAGRNKLFVRGLADSALNGPLQATVGQYLGDLRLSYGSPDPDLALIDIGRVEVFEGPQGTRFGTGSIGGVVRLHPHAPILGETSARYLAGASATSGGGAGGEAAVVLNRPITERAALRLVAYARRDGGFLEPASPGARKADHVDTAGARAMARWSSDAWTVDVLGLAQRVNAGDTQTEPADDTRSPPFDAVLEPYESTILLGGLTARRRLGSLQLTSATSLSRQRLEERFNASQRADAAPKVVDRTQTVTTGASELRVETAPLGGWAFSGGGVIAVGETLVERRHRDLSTTPDPTYGADLRRSFAEAAAFGEAAMSPAPNWRFAIGARLSAVRIDSDIRTVEVDRIAASERDGMTYRLTPSLSARWDGASGLTLFGRLEQAVRPAGVNEAGGAFERYQGDRVSLLEVGLKTRDWRDDLWAEASIGWVDWRDVQADIVTPGGDLVTDNVGDGIIRFVSAKAAWKPTEALDISGGIFINDSSLTRTRPSIIGGGRTDIPNVAPLGAQLSVALDAGSLVGAPLRLGADLRYVGQSRLGVGPALDVPQGGYLRSELTARLGSDARAATVRISNPFDSDGVRYGIGSPYQLSEPQVVPVRPLMIRLTFDAAF